MPESAQSQVTYRIATWDVYEQAFTPQEGVDEIVHGFRGLLKAVRDLKAAGYDAHRNAYSSDPSVYIERIDGMGEAFRERMEQAAKEHPEAFIDPIPFTE